MSFKHHARICRDERDLLAAGCACISHALDDGDGVVVIATATHLREFEAAIPGINAAQRAGHYVQCDADQLLRHFMDGGVPDPSRFRECIETVLRHVDAPRIHVFGEMTGILWGRAEARAAHLIEQLWNQFGPIWGESLDLIVLHPYRLSTFSDVNSVADISAQHASC